MGLRERTRVCGAERSVSIMALAGLRRLGTGKTPGTKSDSGTTWSAESATRAMTVAAAASAAGVPAVAAEAAAAAPAEEPPCCVEVLVVVGGAGKPGGWITPPKWKGAGAVWAGSVGGAAALVSGASRVGAASSAGLSCACAGCAGVAVLVGG